MMIPSGTEGSVSDGLWKNLDPRVRLLCVVSLVVVVSVTPIHFILKFFLYVVLGCFLAVLSGVRGWRYIARVLIFSPMLVWVGLTLWLFPGARGEEGSQLLLVETLVKMILVFSVMGILVLGVPFRDIIRALEALHVPWMVVTMLNFMYRYIFLFLHEAERVIRAIKSRSFGGWKLWKEWKVIGSIVSVFLVRVFERSHRVYWAMLSRGDIRYIPREKGLRFRWYDYVFGIAFHLVLGAIVIM